MCNLRVYCRLAVAGEACDSRECHRPRTASEPLVLHEHPKPVVDLEECGSRNARPL